MSDKSRNKDTSIGYDQLTYSERHKSGRASTSLLTTEQPPESPPPANTENPANYYNRIKPRIMKEVSAWIKNCTRKLNKQYRCFKAYLVPGTGWTLALPDAGWAVIPFNIISMSTAFWTPYRYYAIKDGAYFVHVFFYFDTISNQYITASRLAVFKNGVLHDILDFKSAIGDGSFECLKGSSLVPMICGDYIDIRFYHNDTSSEQFTEANHIYSYLTINYEGCNYTDNNIVPPTWTGRQ